ncbi:hypothetical protein GobsT_50530 [Gemmata obscuriglobus]|nr:hypothetical protein GobsT_50530 [Gemmata obscuriglobus]VTS09574.1 unnamed protein product [Gemmata obscuriglobus UQM 2246]
MRILTTLVLAIFGVASFAGDASAFGKRKKKAAASSCYSEPAPSCCGGASPYGQPYGQGGYGQPVYGQSGYGQPGYAQPVYGRPGMYGPPQSYGRPYTGPGGMPVQMPNR